MIAEFKIASKLKEAFEVSTLSNNAFAKAVASVHWEGSYIEDVVHCFYIGRFTFCTTSLDPFEVSNDWKPEVFFSDGSILGF